MLELVVGGRRSHPWRCRPSAGATRRVVLAGLFLAIASLLTLGARPAHAEPLDPKAVPEPLRPWTAWALHGKAEGLCPIREGAGPQCVWPARLELRLDAQRASFKQTFHVDAKRWVPLPGNDKRWPLDVTVDGKRSVVIPKDGLPSVELDPGDHTVAGSFVWDSLPESLQIPPATALLDLELRGKRVSEPNRDAAGTLWLQKTLTAEEGERLDFVVHRRVVDEVPLQLTTRIVLNVAGQNREVVLGKMLPPGFVPMALQSQLPARVEPDARLRVQVRPGTWTIEVVARSEGPVKELRRPNPEGPWREGEEVWVFDARTNLRLVEVQGVAAIDPAQTSLPDDWKRLPAYPLALGDAMRLVEKRRGDAEPPPDHLTLVRTLWLDFDGKGFTASDTLNGNLRRASRLEMLPPTVLGRVAIGGKDQFITHLEADAARTGVEVRQGDLAVSAESRIVADPRDLPAVGWNHDFHSVTASLHLPPGFRLVHASGVDDVPSTWIKHWTLLELFLALVLAIGVWRLHGPGWGAVALVTFGLTFPESGAPRYVFILVLIAEALVRALDRLIRSSEAPSRGLLLSRRGAGGVRAAGALLVALVAIPFLVEHVRYGLFPGLAANGAGGEGDAAAVVDQLALAGFAKGEKKEAPSGGAASATAVADAPKPATEEPAQAVDGDRAKQDKEQSAKRPEAPPPPPPPPPSDEERKNWDQRRDEEKAGVASRTIAGKLTRSPSSSGADYHQFNANVYDPTSMVQTGPGRPRWSFTQIPLRWSGPVERSQRLHLYLLDPEMNAILAILRAILVIALVLRLLPIRPRLGREGGGTGGAPGRSILRFAVASVGFVLGLGAVSGEARAQATPPKEVLDELASRILAKPSCLPTCAASSRLLLEAKGGVLRMRMEIEASADVAVPLPGSAQWSPANVVADGKPAKALLRAEDGRVYLALGKGWHQVIVEGPLPDRELLQIGLPLKSHHVEAQTEGWRVEGIHEDGLSDDNVQLTRIRSKAAGGGGDAAMEPGVLPPFVRVERTLLIGLDWQVATRVVRLSPPGTAIVLEVPLLPGESVTTADVRVTGGKAQLNLAPQVQEMSWRSVLDQRSPIVLRAPSQVAWTELWRLDMSPVWHADLTGIPVVHAEPSAKLPEWRPWPGETATLAVSRPDGVVGSTLTIDESTYALRPGLRATDATLSLQLRSSRGAQHALTLPEGSVLESVTINGASAPVRQEGRKVTLPVSPGAQAVVLTWRMPTGVGFVFRAPEIDLGAPSVNATTTLALPEGRWILGLRGPRLGPVVLFWSLLLVVFVVAGLVGLMRRAPVPIGHWLLLAVGLSQVNVVAAAFVVGWLHLVAWRDRDAMPNARALFNLRQLGILAATAIAVVILLVTVHQGLLGHPDMQVQGNGSSPNELRWFADRSGPVPPPVYVVSAPTLLYRLLMLGWALWLSLRVVAWLRWGFAAWVAGGAWRRRPPRVPPPMSPHRVPAYDVPGAGPMPPAPGSPGSPGGSDEGGPGPGFPPPATPT